jgi:ABC-type amino acid transport substrate-binding protein
VTRDERRALLSQLLPRVDLSEVPVDELAEAMREARQQQNDLREFIGKAAAAMNRSGKTFAEISKLTGLPNSSLHHWAKPYL